jgi:HSP20 family molecular chaperone IbpA
MNAKQEITGREQAGAELAALLPPVDIVEDEAGIAVTADLPGVAKENLTVRVDGDALIIEAPLTLGESRTTEAVYTEIQAPRYRRSFTLSRELDTGKIEAALKDGVLKLTIPKLEHAKPRRIEVRIA